MDTSRSLRILIAGTGRLAVSLMEPLLASRHQVIGLLQNARPTSKFRRAILPWEARLTHSADSPARLATGNRIPILWLDTMDESELAPIRAAQPDLLITCGFSIILKRPLLDLPRIGCANVHSSLLPRHRGPNPFCQVILEAEKESGVTFHVTEEAIDSGDILDQTPFFLARDETALTVYYKACSLLAERALPVIDAIAEKGMLGIPQDRALAQYEGNIREEDARIDWSQDAKEIERSVRAHTLGLYARFLSGGTLVRVAVSAYDDAAADEVPGTVLQIQPSVRVATGKGTLTILSAYTASPIAWPWPSLWARVKVGDILE
jgi:methionyl-tRNA formyltransferase